MGEPINPEAVSKLRQLGGDDFAIQMIALFREFVPKKLKEAVAGDAAGNLLPVEKAAHAIKSSAANIGAEPLRDLALRLEALARDGAAGEVRRLMPEFSAEIDLVLARLLEVSQSLKAG